MASSKHFAYVFGLVALMTTLGAATAPACAQTTASPLATHAERFGGIELASPLPGTNTREAYWGTQVADPFRFLEDVNDPAVASWMRDQADATARILDKIPGRAALLARLTEIEQSASGVVSQIRQSEGDRWFYLKRDPNDSQFRLVWRQGLAGPEHVIYDPQEPTKLSGKPHAIMDYAPSPDGRTVAYSVQIGGGEIGHLYVVDVNSGVHRIEPIGAIRYAAVSWLDDSSGFFYSRLRPDYAQLPAADRFGDRARHFRSLAASNPAQADRVVFSPSRAPELQFPIYVSGAVAQIPGTRLAALVAYFGVDRRIALYLAELDDVIAGQARWRAVVTQADQVAEVAFAGPWIYLRSNAQAPRFKVLRIPLARPSLANAQVVLAASESVVYELAAAKDALYIAKRDGVLGSLLRVPHAAQIELQPMALPVRGSLSVTADARRDGAILSLGSWTQVSKPYRLEPKIDAKLNTNANEVTELQLAKRGSFDAPAGISSREVMVPSHDGTLVPLSIIARTDLPRTGQHPTILYGYGAYGSTESPFLSPSVYAWIERGGVYAFAHVRGGGMLGSDWHLAGKMTTKPNTWKDAIAAAQWLIQNGYTTPAKLGIYGGSAGGILVGRAITERPDLFAAAVPAVGVLDAVRMELEPNGAANIPEFGTTQKEEQFYGLLAMSAYHAIRDGERYPATLLVHGVNDIRVRVSNSTKFASRLRQAQAGSAASESPRPVLLRLEYQAGHGQGSTREQARERTVDIFSFLLWQFGEAGFAP